MTDQEQGTRGDLEVAMGTQRRAMRRHRFLDQSIDPPAKLTEAQFNGRVHALRRQASAHAAH